MIKIQLLILNILCFFSFLTHANQIGIGALDMQSRNRIGLEAGGFLNRGVGTSAQLRFQRQLFPKTTLELGGGGATGVRDSNLFMAFKRRLVQETNDAPQLNSRVMLEQVQDQNSKNRTQFGAGLLAMRQWSVFSHPVNFFAQPAIKLSVEQETENFGILTELAMGTNSQFKMLGEKWISSVELNLGFSGTPNVLMMGLGKNF